MKANILIFILIGAYFFYSLFAQIKLIRQKNIVRKRKVYQSIFVWILPFIGAWAINWFISYKEPTKEELKKKRWEMNESGVAENV